MTNGGCWPILIALFRPPVRNGGRRRASPLAPKADSLTKKCTWHLRTAGKPLTSVHVYCASKPPPSSWSLWRWCSPFEMWQGEGNLASDICVIASGSRPNEPLVRRNEPLPARHLPQRNEDLVT